MYVVLRIDGNAAKIGFFLTRDIWVTSLFRAENPTADQRLVGQSYRRGWNFRPQAKASQYRLIRPEGQSQYLSYLIDVAELIRSLNSLMFRVCIPAMKPSRFVVTGRG